MCYITVICLYDVVMGLLQDGARDIGYNHLVRVNYVSALHVDEGTLSVLELAVDANHVGGVHHELIVNGVSLLRSPSPSRVEEIYPVRHVERISLPHYLCGSQMFVRLGGHVLPDVDVDCPLRPFIHLAA